MITDIQKEEIKALIGHRYVSIVQDELNSKAEFDSKGKTYSTAMITNVMNGKPNAVIEDAIYRVVAQKKALNKKREEILKSA